MDVSTDLRRFAIYFAFPIARDADEAEIGRT